MRFEVPDLPRALCREMDPELYWFDSNLTTEQLTAKKLCMTCPEVRACLEWGLKHETEGMWGGTTPIERAKIRRRKGMVVARPDYQVFLHKVVPSE